MPFHNCIDCELCMDSKWGTPDDDKKGSGGAADGQTLPRYRPPSAFQRYGRRPGGGGG